MADDRAKSNFIFEEVQRLNTPDERLTRLRFVLVWADDRAKSNFIFEEVQRLNTPDERLTRLRGVLVGANDPLACFRFRLAE